MFSTSLIMIPYPQNGHFVRLGFGVECENQTKLFVDSDGPLVAVHLFVVKTLPISQRSLVRCCPNYDQFLSQRVDHTDIGNRVSAARSVSMSASVFSRNSTSMLHHPP